MSKRLDDYAFTVHLDVPFEQAREKTEAALQEQGFGIVTEIDMQRTFRQKLGIEFRQYGILGACNPELANRALTAEPMIGLLLPCNVILFEDAGGEGTTVSVVDPMGLLGDIDVAELQAVAEDAHDRLSKVAAALAG